MICPRWTDQQISISILMNKIKVLVSSLLLISLSSLSGCYATKAGNYITEKSKAGWSATKSFFGADE